MKEELKTVFKFLKEANEVARELSALSGETGRQRQNPKRGAHPKGYVLKTKETPLLQKALSAKRAELNLSLLIEPPLGEPINLTANIKLRRGGNDPRGKNNRFGG